MALLGSSMVSTGATLAVGTQVLFDSVVLNSTTVQVEVVKLGAGVAGSSALIPSSSGSALDGPGLQVNVVNSTASAIGVQIQGGQSSVTISGNSTAIISTASRIVADISTASKILAELTGGQSSVTVTGPVAVTDNAGSLTVDFSNANSSVNAILSTAGMGGSTGSPVYVNLQQFNSNSTFASTVVTSTTAVTLFSSAASTRFIITDLEIMNQGGTIVLAVLFDGASGGTVIDRTYCATAGGGKSAHYITPIYNTTGNAITFQIDAASTVVVNARGYRSS